VRKMTSDALKQLIQENSAEAAHVDFKQEWHRNKAKLIHDILCLSNADYAGDRVLTRGMRVDSTISSPNPVSEQSYLCVRSTRRIARKPLLPCLHEVLGPFVIYALSDAFTATQLSNAVFATKAIQHDPDLLFG